ncbi:RidA family protein [Halodesulfovibrio spirochaetisodalis]|uniref:Endoribonuclease L-PSP n=1 Tax=Halodesulfovibrio spirochaetisodalis TaxID=1560234 RepID=A0A1B7XIA7_9BACT|nr:RidA family protein [Halodesulfovibrio spirochaetisodalis]OBQ55243.1 endoribonuclease L-PSP [Halodesulfovibrio spirochaetisodalis]
MKVQIKPADAPAAVGPYSHSIRMDNLLFISGQLPIDPATGAICEGSIEDSTRQSLNNLKAIVEEAGATMDDVAKTTVFLADVADGPAANKVYAEFFSEPYPARSAFQVAALPLGARIEIEAIVVLK